MATFEKHNMGRGDYWIYRPTAATKSDLIEDLRKIIDDPSLNFPLFVNTMPPAFPISLEFRNRDEIRYFIQGYSFAVYCFEVKGR